MLPNPRRMQMQPYITYNLENPVPGGILVAMAKYRPPDVIYRVLELLFWVRIFHLDILSFTQTLSPLILEISFLIHRFRLAFY